MYVTGDRCLQCGARARPATLEAQYGLRSDGSFYESEHWFCSVKCYQKAVRPFISDENYDFDKGLYDAHPRLPEIIEDAAHNEVDWFTPSVSAIEQKKYEEYSRKWRDKKSDIIGEAEYELARRIGAEAAHNRQEQEAKELAAIEKEIEREQLQAERGRRERELWQEREEREAQRQLQEQQRKQARRQSERERQKDKEMREQERLQREREKWQQEELKRLEEEAEEEKWRPRPFDI